VPAIKVKIFITTSPDAFKRTTAALRLKAAVVGPCPTQTTAIPVGIVQIFGYAMANCNSLPAK